MNSLTTNTDFAVLGCPIRTPSDQSLLGSSPRLFAAFHVLHRSLAPRHSPYALTSLSWSVFLTTTLRPPSRKSTLLEARFQNVASSECTSVSRRIGFSRLFRARFTAVRKPTVRIV